MEDCSAAPEVESNTVRVCSVCGYVLADCVTHPGVHPLILAGKVREVERKSEDHVLALSSFHAQRSKWDKRIKDATKH